MVGTQMLRAALAILMMSGMSARGQGQTATSEGAENGYRASAYYYYVVAHMYAEMAAAAGGRNQTYVNKAIENYKMALKADPQMPVTSEQLSGIYTKRLTPPFPIILIATPWPPAPRPPAPR
jgi:hypothetical protein